MYYLNADFDYWNMLDWNKPDIDCLHTVDSKSQVIEMRKSFKVGPPMPMPQQMTICLRTLHYTFMFPKSSYAFAFFFGSLLPVNFFSYLIFLNSNGGIGSLLSILHKYIPDKQIPTNTNHITLLTL